MAGDHPIRKYREATGKTQEALAKELGVSPNTVWRWEAGERKIETAKLPKVSELTGIPKRELRPDLADLISEAAE